MPANIGVLITYYNERELLTACLHSLIAQTKSPDEILVYDNASDSPAKDYIPDGCPVRIIRADTNRGPSYGRNQLLAASQSDYVHFHDADDFFSPVWCELVGQAIDEGNPDVVFTEVSFCKDEQVSEGMLNLDRLILGKELIQFLIEDTFGIGVPTGTYRRTKVQAVGGYTESLWYGEDLDFHVRLAQSGVTFRGVDEPLVNLRMRSSSHCHSDRVKTTKEFIETILKVADELPPRYHDFLAEEIAKRAIILFRMGDRVGAHEAITRSRRLGRPSFSEQHRFYQFLANRFGLETTERLGAYYRGLIPNSARKFMADRRLFQA